MASAFFYGTLLHPQVLKRVLGHDGQHLQVATAILLEYTRHYIRVSLCFFKEQKLAFQFL